MKAERRAEMDLGPGEMAEELKASLAREGMRARE